MVEAQELQGPVFIGESSIKPDIHLEGGCYGIPVAEQEGKFYIYNIYGGVFHNITSASQRAAGLEGDPRLQGRVVLGTDIDYAKLAKEGISEGVPGSYGIWVNVDIRRGNE